MTTANKTKVTLNSVLFASAPTLPELPEGKTHTKTVLAQFKQDVSEHVDIVSQNFAMYLIEKSPIDLKVMVEILSATAKKLPSVLEEVEKQRQEAIAQKEKERQEEEERADKRRKEEEARILADKQKMLDFLKNSDTGLDLEIAAAALEEIANKHLKNLGSTNKATYNRVECEIDGKTYQVPVRGNMSQELKELAAKHGFADNREGLINQFRKTPAASGETTEA